MPTYIFKNKKTEQVFELQMRISELDAYKSDHPDLKQVPTAPNFRLKGTGWYETDSNTLSPTCYSQRGNEKQLRAFFTENKKTTKDEPVKSDSFSELMMTAEDWVSERNFLYFGFARKEMHPEDAF